VEDRRNAQPCISLEIYSDRVPLLFIARMYATLVLLYMRKPAVTHRWVHGMQGPPPVTVSVPTITCAM
jgi:hypothetical protein